VLAAQGKIASALESDRASHATFERLAPADAWMVDELRRLILELGE